MDGVVDSPRAHPSLRRVLVVRAPHGHAAGYWHEQAMRLEEAHHLLELGVCQVCPQGLRQQGQRGCEMGNVGVGWPTSALNCTCDAMQPSASGG